MALRWWKRDIPPSVELLPDAPALGWDCPGFDNDLMRLRIVIKDGALSVERCYQSSTSAGRNGCSTEPLKIDVVAMQKARELNTLASPQVQAAQSATKLPADNDMANVFHSPASVGGTAPICSHWHYSFSRLGDFLPGQSALTPSARISGSSDRDRVFIHPTNPEICDANLEPRCNAKSYLIPGDRVDVGYICARRTYIRYRHRTNATSDIFGWIPTSRLYSVESLISPDPKRSAAYWTRYIHKDALLVAVANQDVRQVALLMATHQQFDVLRALHVAINDQDLAIVNSLLSQDFDLKPHCSDLMESAMSASPEVLHALVHFGLDMSCNKAALVQIAGDDRFNDLDFRLSVWGSWTPLRDLPGRVQEFLSAGIPVDWSLPDGRTALFATVQPNNVDVAQLLLRNGADPRIARSDGALPIDIARNNHHENIARFIASHSAKN